MDSCKTNRVLCTRLQVQRYAKEEKKLLEDLRCGMIIWSKKFIDKIRNTYLPQKPHKEIPQQRDLAKDIDPVVKLKEAAKILDCDLDHFKQVSRITKSARDDRNLLVFCVWKTGILTENKIGNLFGMTYSSISHIVKTVRLRIDKDQDLKEKYSKIYTLFRI